MMFIRVILLVALSRAAAAQLPGIAPPKAATQQPQAEDPLGRSTPRGTITGFTEAVHRNDLAAAVRYLQLNDSQRPNADTLARKLSQLIDRYYGEPIHSIDASRTGALDDGLPEDRERIGPLSVDSKRIDVELVRVSDSLAGPVWLLSSETLREVPALHRLIKSTWFERVMPPAFVRPSLFGVSLAQWIMLAATIAVPIIVLRLLFGALMRIARRTVGPTRRGAIDSMYASLRWPAIVVLTLAIHLSYMPFMRLPLAFRISYARLGFVVLIVALAWLLRRALTVASDRARYLMAGGAHSGARSLIMLGERLVKALVVVVAALAILTVLGVDTKTALAGLGIGGVALALGAQKSVENLLGGVFLLSDRALAVGDTCSIANRVGVDEDITLRSIRLRTAEQTLLSIPAGTLSGSSVENFATRAKILLQTRLHLRAATSVAHVRSTLDQVQALLETHPELEHETSRIRLIDFGADAVELELSAYVLTADNTRFLEVRQDLLLQIAEIVEASGTLLPHPAPQAVAPAVATPVRNPVATDDARLARS